MVTPRAHRTMVRTTSQPTSRQYPLLLPKRNADQIAGSAETSDHAMSGRQVSVCITVSACPAGNSLRIKANTLGDATMAPISVTDLPASAAWVGSVSEAVSVRPHW